MISQLIVSKLTFTIAAMDRYPRASRTSVKIRAGWHPLA